MIFTASFTNRGTKQNPSWQYTVSRYVDGKYKPIRKGGFKTRKEAQIAAAEVENRLNKGERIDNTPVVFVQFFENWFTLYKTDVTPQTLNHYKDTLRYINEYFGLEKTLQSMTRDEYQLFLNEYGKKYSKEVMLKVHGHIKAAVEHAVEEQLIRFNFATKVKVIGKPGKNKNDKYLHFEQSDKLYNELFNRLDLGLSYYAVLLLLVSGMRFEELVGLTRADFDFTKNTININKVWGYNHKMKSGFGPTKNEQSKRIIKIDDKVMREFKKLFMRVPDNVNRLVFFSATSKYKCLSNNAVNKSLRKVLDDLDIKNKITCHELRHTHASALIYKKATIPYICERLGHSSPDITYKRYSHVMKELREEDEQIAVNLY